MAAIPQRETLRAAADFITARLNACWTDSMTADVLVDVCRNVPSDRIKEACLLIWVCRATDTEAVRLRAKAAADAVTQKRIVFADVQPEIVHALLYLFAYPESDPPGKLAAFEFTLAEQAQAERLASASSDLELVGELISVLGAHQQELKDWLAALQAEPAAETSSDDDDQIDADHDADRDRDAKDEETLSDARHHGPASSSDDLVRIQTSRMD
jgi:hypothetical protein